MHEGQPKAINGTAYWLERKGPKEKQPEVLWKIHYLVDFSTVPQMKPRDFTFGRKQHVAIALAYFEGLLLRVHEISLAPRDDPNQAAPFVAPSSKTELLGKSRDPTYVAVPELLRAKILRTDKLPRLDQVHWNGATWEVAIVVDDETYVFVRSADGREWKLKT